METQRVTAETRRNLAEKSEELYDEGGALVPGTTTITNDTGAPIRVVPAPRGTIVMSQASFEAMQPDVLERITRHSDVVVSNEG